MTTAAPIEQDIPLTRAVMDQLRAVRQDLGISQKDAASALGVVPSTLSDLELASAEPKISTVIAYARMLGVTLKFSVTDEEGNVWTEQ